MADLSDFGPTRSVEDLKGIITYLKRDLKNQKSNDLDRMVQLLLTGRAVDIVGHGEEETKIIIRDLYQRAQWILDVKAEQYNG